MTFFQEFLHSGNMTDAGPQDQIDDSENDQESVSLPGVLHGKPAIAPLAPRGHQQSNLICGLLFSCLLVYYDGHSLSCQVIFTSVKRHWGENSSSTNHFGEWPAAHKNKWRNH